MLKIILIYFVILSYFHCNATQPTPPNCPVRPTSDIRGPPGIPGRKGEPGYGKYTKSIFVLCL